MLYMYTQNKLESTRIPDKYIYRPSSASVFVACNNFNNNLYSRTMHEDVTEFMQLSLNMQLVLVNSLLLCVFCYKAAELLPL